MKLQIDKAELVRVIDRCAMVSDPKGLQPHVDKVLISASRDDDGDGLQFIASDGHKQIDQAAAATIEAPGACAVSARRLQVMAHALPEGIVKMALKDGDGRLLVTCGTRRYALPYMDADQYPAVSEPEEGAPNIEVPTNILKRAIARVRHTTGQDKDKPWLEGVRIEAVDGMLSAVCTNGHAMAWQESQIADRAHWECLLPTGVLPLVDSLCGDNLKLRLYHQDSAVYFEGPDVLAGALLPRGGFPPWRQLIDSFVRAPVGTVDADTFLGTMRGVIVGATGDDTKGAAITLLEMNPQDRTLRVSLVRSECDAVDIIEFDAIDGAQPLTAQLSSRYLVDFARALGGSFVIEGGGKDPILISTDDGFLGVIMRIHEHQ